MIRYNIIFSKDLQSLIHSIYLYYLYLSLSHPLPDFLGIATPACHVVTCNIPTLLKCSGV